MAFSFEPYRSPFTNSIAETMLRRGDIAARAAERLGAIQGQAAQQSGQGWASALMGTGQAFAAVPGQIQATKAQQQESQLRALQIQGAQRQTADMAALDKAYQTGVDRDSILNALPGHLRPIVSKQFSEADEQKLKVQKLKGETAVAERDYFGSLAAGVKPFLGEADGGLSAAMIALQHARDDYPEADKLWEQIKADPSRLPQMIDQLIQSSPKQVELLNTAAGHAETARHNVATEGQAATAGQAAADREATTAAETARHNQEVEKISRMSAGRAAAAQAETARHNRAMEENARNAKIGRPVIAGDAEDLSNFDTSLDDLKTLRSAIAGSGATGVRAQIGAGLRDWVTDLTGWGTDAKKKQALIDRVKQVIGKALEGGVLRKEDELKYEKILPTIRDTNEVVLSKLDGLDASIAQRKQRRLDSMQDAGFDVSRFRAREGVSDLRERARGVLKGNGMATDDAAVATFLKNNPGFK